MTKLINCTCTHDYQNRIYNGKRLANIKANGEARCTVCGKEHKKDVKK